MKKLFLFSAVTAGLFTSCVQNDLIVPELSEAEKEIKFQTVVAKHSSRAIITGAEYSESAPPFGAYAFWNRSNVNFLPGSEHHIINQKIIHHESNSGTHYWGPESGEHLWPKDGSLTFYAYSPFNYQESGNESQPLTHVAPLLGAHGFKFENYNVGIHQETDLMVADIVYGKTSNDATVNGHTGVPTVFRHKLAIIAGFILKTSDNYDGAWDGTDNAGNGAVEGDQRFKIQKIELQNIPVQGTFQSEGIESDGELIPESWTISSTASVEESAEETNPEVIKTFVWYDSSHDTVNPYGLLFGYEAYDQLHLYNPNIGLIEYKSNYKYADPEVPNDYILAIPQEFLEGSTSSLHIKYTVEIYTKESDGNFIWKNTRDKPNVEGEDLFIEKTIPLKTIHADPQKDYHGWGIGKKIVYILDFSTEEIRWAPSVADWEDDQIKVDY